ncbi:hypothetical protein C5C56_15520 [Rathayibacter sp. AY1D1]|uniref:hypothetical protein n=1 Tax=Rathayibacter sp. AY1D1 TaxID=2080542 RepID=UPI000CE7EF59|nr:hypothetical protein [Rathayibacter sp. AY1D1]PPH96038.1 hypothetical protein C5C56_15520 [Rathayibacter sp. AY1D1]
MSATARTLIEITSTSLVLAITLWLGPLLAKEHPTWHPVAHYAIPALLAVAVTVVVRFFVLVRAHVQIEWTRPDENVPLQELEASIKRRNRMGMQPYVATLQYKRSYGLGWLALRVGIRAGLWVRADAVHGQLLIVREWQDGPANEVRARSGPDCSAEMRLVRPVPGVDTVWNTAQFRFNGKRGHGTQTRRSELKHHAVGSTWLSDLCAKLITVDSRANNIVERWS